jgi:TusA-related sulfurtransferase
MNETISEYFERHQRKAPEVVDLRGLEPPEPLVNILLTCSRMKRDEEFLVHLPHVPNPLFPHLEAREMEWRVFEQTDGSALVLIWSVS